MSESKLPEKIYPVDYAGFWDFSPDGMYGDSLINEMDYPNAEQIANEIAMRYNTHTELVETLKNLINANPNDSTWNYPAAADAARLLLQSIQEKV
jgi:hypothetical protein